MTRPPILGVHGKTYFACNETTPFHTVFPGMEIFLDGQNVHCMCNEVDLIGGWVGILWEKFKGIKRGPTWVWEDVDYTDVDTGITERRRMQMPHYPPHTQRYIRGVVAIRRPIRHQRRPIERWPFGHPGEIEPIKLTLTLPQKVEGVWISDA